MRPPDAAPPAILRVGADQPTGMNSRQVDACHRLVHPPQLVNRLAAIAPLR